MKVALLCSLRLSNVSARIITRARCARRAHPNCRCSLQDSSARNCAMRQLCAAPALCAAAIGLCFRESEREKLAGLMPSVEAPLHWLAAGVTLRACASVCTSCGFVGQRGGRRLSCQSRCRKRDARAKESGGRAGLRAHSAPLE